MRFLFALLAGLCLVAAAPVLADDGPTAPATTIVADDVVITATAATVAPAVALDSGDQLIVKDVIGDVVDVITDPAPVSVLVIVALIIAALVKLTKLGVLARFLEDKGKTWVRPLIAAALGGAGAVVTALTAGTRDAVGLVAAFVAGAWAGFSAAGSVDAARVVFFPDARDKRSVNEADLAEVAAVVEGAAVGAQVDAGKHVTAARDAVAHTAELPAAKRVEALAGLLRARR